MKIKICGMREPENISRIARLPVQWMGFIFYLSSPRYAGALSPEIVQQYVPGNIERIGVFVNETEACILSIAERYRLDGVQLHGEEPPALCAALKATGLKVIKAFSVAKEIDLNISLSYEGTCHYFLFDTKAPVYGGSGKQYDWNILTSYQGHTPFLLSGGIGEEDVERLRAFRHPLCEGIDLNSRFEELPGRKDVVKLERFLSRFLSQQADSK